MSALSRRVARMEGDRPPVACRRCHNKTIGVRFTHPAPGDYEGEGAPMPLACPDCGRRMTKTYIWGARADWDRLWRGA